MANIVGVGWEREELDAQIQSTRAAAEAAVHELTRYNFRPYEMVQAHRALEAHIKALTARAEYQKRWEAAQRWDEQRKAEAPLW